MPRLIIPPRMRNKPGLANALIVIIVVELLKLKLKAEVKGLIKVCGNPNWY